MHDAQGLDFLPESNDLLLFLAENGVRIFQESRQLTPRIAASNLWKLRISQQSFKTG